MSFIIRKRTQIDNFSELPREKRPTDELIWNGSVEELESWFNKVLVKNKPSVAELVIQDNEIEG